MRDSLSTQPYHSNNNGHYIWQITKPSPSCSSVPNPHTPRKKKVADRPPVAPPNLSSYYEDNELLGCYANQVRQLDQRGCLWLGLYLQGVPTACGLRLGWLRFWMLHHLAQLLSHFCQNSICPSRTGQIHELLRSKLTQPRSASWRNTLYNGNWISGDGLRGQRWRWSRGTEGRSDLQQRGRDRPHPQRVWPPRRNDRVSWVQTQTLQGYSSTLSQGFKDEDMGNSPGWWVATVASYCPNRPSQLLETTVTKHCDRVDE